MTEQELLERIARHFKNLIICPIPGEPESRAQALIDDLGLTVRVYPNGERVVIGGWREEA